jgi:hypothetical protein
MGTRPESERAEAVRRRLEAQLPRPTASFRRHAWLAFQRALDPFGPPKKPFRIGLNGADRSFQTDAGGARHPEA